MRFKTVIDVHMQYNLLFKIFCKLFCEIFCMQNVYLLVWLTGRHAVPLVTKCFPPNSYLREQRIDLGWEVSLISTKTYYLVGSIYMLGSGMQH